MIAQCTPIADKGIPRHGYMNGTLWVVATPIGNLGDLSPRALNTLRSVALIAAEDTRHTRHLLAHFGLATPLRAMHEHNEENVAAQLLKRLQAGEDIALVSDAGTPLISDPGYRLVRAARQAGLKVATLPGPSALIAALSVAGLASDRFVFEGFLPARQTARYERLASLAAETRTLIFYESSHRIRACLADAASIFGAEREATLARELTKLHETVLSMSLGELAARVAADDNQCRGELVLLVAGAKGGDEERKSCEGRRIFALLRRELPPGRAARLAAAISGAPRRILYEDAKE